MLRQYDRAAVRRNGVAIGNGVGLEAVLNLGCLLVVRALRSGEESPAGNKTRVLRTQLASKIRSMPR